MDGVFAALAEPGFYLLELLTLGAVIFLFRDSRIARTKLHERIDIVMMELRKHETKCAERHAEDQRWKGNIEARLKALENRK